MTTLDAIVIDAPDIPDGYAHLLGQPFFGHLATIRRDGAPQVNPVWYAWDGELLRFTSTTNRQKYRNVQADPRISMSIIDPALPYRMLEVRGVVDRIEPDPTGAFYAHLSARYGGDGKPPPHPENRVNLVARPTAYAKN